MQKKLLKHSARVLLLIITILLLFTSCILRKPAESKEKILENIEITKQSNSRNYSYVTDYLRHWGFPIFDASKMKWAENVFYKYYNYDGGIESSEAFDSALLVADIFLNEYYDEIDKSSSAAVTDALIASFVEITGDPYAIYRTPEVFDEYDEDMSGSFGGIGVVIEYNHQDESLMVSTVYDGAPAAKAGFKVGDFIHAINGEAVSEIGYLNAVDKIRGKVGTSVTVTVLRDGEYIDLTAIRAIVEEKSIDYEITSEGFGYIRISTFKGNTDEQFALAVDYLREAGVRGIIFDVRNNTGGYLDTVANMLSYILPTGKTIVTYNYKNSDPTSVISKDDGVDSSGKPYDSVLNIPMVVLCNEYTASAAEIFTAAIRDYNKEGLFDATTVGTTTYKKGIMQSSVLHTDGSSITLTVAYYDPPCGENYHGIGITPDVIVEADGLTDNQLEIAKAELSRLLLKNDADASSILSSIEQTKQTGSPEYDSVSNYLYYWGIPVFDISKMLWVEEVFETYYNYEGGLSSEPGDILLYAEDVAEIFLEYYYSEIDINDKEAVTDALIYSYVEVSGDPYAVYRLPEVYEDFDEEMSGRFGGVGMMVEYDHQNETIMVSTVYADSPAEAAGFKVGDFIHAINGETIEEIGYLDAVYKIRGEIGTPVEVTVIRNGEYITLTAIRGEVIEKSVSYEIKNNVGYVTITTFKENTDEQFAEAIDALHTAGVAGVIFDLRNNTGGYLSTVVNMVSYILPTGLEVVSYQYKGRAKVTLYTTSDYFDEQTGAPMDSVLDLPMAVLCNEYTASAAEIFTSVIRDYRNTDLIEAVTIGTVTYKKGIMQASFVASDNSYITLTIAYYNPPSGENYHGIGITPDIIIELTSEGDAQMERAEIELEKLINAN